MTIPNWTVIYREGDRRHWVWKRTERFTEAEMARGYASILNAQGTKALVVDADMCDAVGLPEDWGNE